MESQGRRNPEYNAASSSRNTGYEAPRSGSRPGTPRKGKVYIDR
jgi:hypothetical protein